MIGSDGRQSAGGGLLAASSAAGAAASGAAAAWLVDDPEEARRAELQASFREFFARSYPLVERFLWRLCADRDLVEEAAQEAFITALAKWETVSRHDLPLIWVRKTARYKLWGLQRQRQRQNEVTLDDVPPRFLVQPADAREAQQSVLYLLRRLPQRQAAVLALAADGCTDEEISRELDLTVNTVRTYKTAARQKMRELAERAGYPAVAGRRRT